MCWHTVSREKKRKKMAPRVTTGYQESFFLFAAMWKRYNVTKCFASVVHWLGMVVVLFTGCLSVLKACMTSPFSRKGKKGHISVVFFLF
uniref:Uncharacterized protein n=1 Tax=Anguilla anguilla TaxID=7936 RepID=A0A0E9WC39_ANGAN